MIHLNLKNTIEKSYTNKEKRIRKTIIVAKVDNGYLVVKRQEKLAEDGYPMEGDNEKENVFIYQENPLKDVPEKEYDIDMSQSLSEIVEGLK